MCLQALRVQHEELAGRFTDAELVATLPPGMPGIARTTDQVLLEMLRPPVEEVILLGYELTDQTVMRLLAEVEATGADVIVICDRTRGTADRVLELGLRRPRVFQDRERKDGPPYLLNARKVPVGQWDGPTSHISQLHVSRVAWKYRDRRASIGTSCFRGAQDFLAFGREWHCRRGTVIAVAGI